MAFALFVLYLSTFIVEGALRSALASLGIGGAIYLRDVVAVALVVAITGRAMLIDRWLDMAAAVVISILTVHFAVSLIESENPLQTVFGLKIFLPLVLGATMFGPVIRMRYDAVRRFMGVALLVSLAGVYINHLTGPMPWEGEEYDTAFGSVSTSMQWWTMGGAARLPGFARSSFDAALAVALCGMIILLETRRALVTLFVSVACLVAIYLTTTKGLVPAFLFFLIWRAHRSWSGNRSLGAAMIAGICLLALGVPVLTVGFDLPSSVDLRAAPDVLQSLRERMESMWPNAIELMVSPGAVWFGQGLGSIGAAQFFAGEREPSMNAGDNLFVYLFVTLGIPGVCYALAIAFDTIRRRQSDDAWAPFRIGSMIILFSYGVTTNIIESALFLTMIGLVIGESLSPVRPRDADRNRSRTGMKHRAHARSSTALSRQRHERVAHAGRPWLFRTRLREDTEALLRIGQARPIVEQRVEPGAADPCALLHQCHQVGDPDARLGIGKAGRTPVRPAEFRDIDRDRLAPVVRTEQRLQRVEPLHQHGRRRLHAVTPVVRVMTDAIGMGERATVEHRPHVLPAIPEVDRTADEDLEVSERANRPGHGGEEPCIVGTVTARGVTGADGNVPLVPDLDVAESMPAILDQMHGIVDECLDVGIAGGTSPAVVERIAVIEHQDRP